MATNSELLGKTAVAIFILLVALLFGNWLKQTVKSEVEKSVKVQNVRL